MAEIFGIELRRKDAFALFRDVDRVLELSAKGDGRPVSRYMQQQTVAHSLTKMVKVGTHFDVCTVRHCSELCGVLITKERMEMYSSIHCMNWNEMTPEYRDAVVAMVLDDFRAVLLPEVEG